MSSHDKIQKLHESYCVVGRRGRNIACRDTAQWELGVNERMLVKPIRPNFLLDSPCVHGGGDIDDYLRR